MTDKGKVKRVVHRSAKTKDHQGKTVPYVVEFDESHPYFEFVDQDPYSHDHKEYERIFRMALPPSFETILFDASVGKTHQALATKDFEPCENRRLESYGAQWNVLEEKTEIVRRGVTERWRCASSFADAIVREFQNCENIEHPKDELERLEKSVQTLRYNLSQTPRRNWDDNQIEELYDLIIKMRRIAQIEPALRQRSFAKVHRKNFAAHTFAYQIQHLTHCQFGQAASDKFGKFSGRGLPFLTAKIVNRLFRLESAKERLDSNAVHQIYKRGSQRISKFNIDHQPQLSGLKEWADDESIEFLRELNSI